jgi:hypothetical protein
VYNSANFAGPNKGALYTQLVIMLKHWAFFIIKNEYYFVSNLFKNNAVKTFTAVQIIDGDIYLFSR